MAEVQSTVLVGIGMQSFFPILEGHHKTFKTYARLNDRILNDKQTDYKIFYNIKTSCKYYSASLHLYIV